MLSKLLPRTFGTEVIGEFKTLFAVTDCDEEFETAVDWIGDRAIKWSCEIELEAVNDGTTGSRPDFCKFSKELLC